MSALESRRIPMALRPAGLSRLGGFVLAVACGVVVAVLFDAAWNRGYDSPIVYATSIPGAAFGIVLGMFGFVFGIRLMAALGGTAAVPTGVRAGSKVAPESRGGRKPNRPPQRR
jgi:F0F1-type ATP synthase membrane subunit c/vacuolar-type H+-ATPase subunit K